MFHMKTVLEKKKLIFFSNRNAFIWYIFYLKRII